MLTLAEAAKLETGDEHRRAVIELFAQSTPLLGVLPFQDITGNALNYNREEALPGIGFRGVNEAFTESTGVLNPQTEALVIAGGDLDVDRFIVNTMGAGQRAVHEAMKVKALAHQISDSFIKGDAVSNPKQFDGLQARLPTSGSQVVAAGATSGGDALSLAKMDEAIDKVENPTHLFMSKAMRRRFTAAARTTTVGGHIDWTTDSFGRQVQTYNGLPILEADSLGSAYATLAFDEANPGGGSAVGTSIYVLSIGPGMLHGIQNEGMSVRDLGELDTKPAFRTRVEWFVSIALFHPRAACRLWGIKDAAIVA